MALTEKERVRSRRAVAWIAENDDGSETDPKVIETYISVLLVADVFDIDPATIAKAVSQKRKERR